MHACNTHMQLACVCPSALGAALPSQPAQDPPQFQVLNHVRALQGSNSSREVRNRGIVIIPRGRPAGQARGLHIQLAGPQGINAAGGVQHLPPAGLGLRRGGRGGRIGAMWSVEYVEAAGAMRTHVGARGPLGCVACRLPLSGSQGNPAGSGRELRRERDGRAMMQVRRLELHRRCAITHTHQWKGMRGPVPELPWRKRGRRTCDTWLAPPD
jgi:hypothetical protein